MSFAMMMSSHSQIHTATPHISVHLFGDRVKVIRQDGEVNAKGKLRQPKKEDKAAALNASNVTWDEIQQAFETLID